MTTPAGKTYLPTFDKELTKVCDYATKHATIILAAVAILSPADATAMGVAIANIQAACALVGRIHRIQDPNYGDNLAD
jgi:hypothetical protein